MWAPFEDNRQAWDRQQEVHRGVRRVLGRRRPWHAALGRADADRPSTPGRWVVLHLQSGNGRRRRPVSTRRIARDRRRLQLFGCRRRTGTRTWPASAGQLRRCGCPSGADRTVVRGPRLHRQGRLDVAARPQDLGHRGRACPATRRPPIPLRAHPAAALWTRYEGRAAVRENRTYLSGTRANDSFPASAIERFSPNSDSQAVEWQWTLADIVTSLLEAGLQLSHLGEYPEPFWRPAEAGCVVAWAGKLPNASSLLATKPA